MSLIMRFSSYRRTDLFPQSRLDDILMFVDIEYEQWDLIVHAKTRRRRVHDLKALVQDLNIGQ